MPYVFNPFSGNFDQVDDISELVTGPASSTDNAIARFDSTTGKLLQNSSAFVQDDGRVTAGADGSSALDLTTKQQLDAAISGVDVKEGTRVATTVNITLSGEQTIDGVLTSANRVLVKNQSDPKQNGIYVSAAGAWSRSTDADSGAELSNALVTVQAGSTQANTGWYQITDDPVLGVDNIVFNQFFGAGTYTADGLGIELSGSTFSLELDGSTLSKSASGLKVAVGGITNTEVNAAAAIAYSKLNLSGSIVNADVNAAAAIVYSKLNLSNSIVNADINTAAAIAYSKLNLALSIVNADIAVGAAIAYAKLNLSNSIVNADINTAAAIAYSKLNLSLSIVNADIAVGAAIAYAKLNLSNSIVNADVAAGAAITRSKLANGTAFRILANDSGGVISENAAITASRAVASDANGQLVAATTTAAELNFVNGVTSAIQTQIDGKQTIFATANISTDVALAANSINLVNTGAARALTLPSAVNNRRLYVKDSTGTAEANNITITPPAGTIDGAASYVISSNYGGAHFISDGSNWFVL